jgi:hypothetical protein
MYRIADQKRLFDQVTLDHLTTRKDETHGDLTDANSETMLLSVTSCP